MILSFKGFLGEVSRPARIASSFLSVNAVRYLSRFSYSSDPVVVSLLTILFTWKWLSWKQAPTFSANFSSILVFEIQPHCKQTLFNGVLECRHAVTSLKVCEVLLSAKKTGSTKRKSVIVASSGCKTVRDLAA